MANGQITSAVESAVITALKIAKPEFAPAIEILASLFAAYEAAKGVGAFTEDQVAQHQALAASQVVARNFGAPAAEMAPVAPAVTPMPVAVSVAPPLV